MKEYKKIVLSFLQDVRYMIPVIIVALLGFGFVITHSSVNIDTLSYDRYFEEGLLLEQERFAAPLLNKIFSVMRYNPWFVDALAVILLIAGAIAMCSLFKKLTNDKLHWISYIIYSCLFISYPLMPEIFTYTPASLNMSIGYLLTTISIIIQLEFAKEKKLVKHLISPILLCVAISLYESFASVYLLLVFLVLILESLYADQKIEFKEIVKKFGMLMLDLILAIAINYLIIKILFIVFKLKKNNYAAKTIYYMVVGIIPGIKNLIKSIINNYVACALFYFPLTVFISAIIIAIIYGIIQSIRKRDIVLILLFVGSIVSALSLSIIQGNSAPYRTCQTFAVFVGFVFMILGNETINIKKVKILKYVIIACIGTLIFYQAQELHKWFYLNYIRYEEEENIVRTIGNEIMRECDITKPIVFNGIIELSNNIKEQIYVKSSTPEGELFIKIYNFVNNEDLHFGTNEYIKKIPDSNVNSYINWGMTAFGEPGVEIIKWFNMLGYDFQNGTMEMYNKAKEEIKKSEIEPKSGTIIEYDEYILVNF